VVSGCGVGVVVWVWVSDCEKASLEFGRGVGPGGWVLYRIIMVCPVLVGGKGGSLRLVGVGRVRACAVLRREGWELGFGCGFGCGASAGAVS